MKKIFCLLGAVFLCLTCPWALYAQSKFPSAPVHLVVPYPPGAITDTLPRMIAEKLRMEWDQPVVVDNRPGAGGRIATEFVAKATPDGYTLLVGLPDTLTIAPSLYRKVNYSIRDFAPVVLMAKQAFVIVTRADLPVTRLAELIAMARAKPQTLKMSSWGEGSTGHLALELLREASGVDILHIPYKGAQAALTDLVGGQVDMMITGYSTSGPHVKSARLRVLARTSLTRSSLTPEIATVAESGYPGYEVMTWYGLVAPGGTPKAVIDQINRAVQKALASPDIKEKIDSFYAEVGGGGADEFEKMINEDALKWARVIERAKIIID